MKRSLKAGFLVGGILGICVFYYARKGAKQLVKDYKGLP